MLTELGGAPLDTLCVISKLSTAFRTTIRGMRRPNAGYPAKFKRAPPSLAFGGWILINVNTFKMAVLQSL
jgi:hypothetical protein